MITCLQFLRFAILARMLDAVDFGVMSMVLVISGFAQVLANAGLGEAIIQRSNPTNEHLSSLYWLNVATGLLLFVTLWAATPLVAALYREPRVTNILFWIALSLPVAAVGKQFGVLLHKGIQFKRLAFVEVVAEVIGTCVAIGLAVAGHTLFALVWGLLAAVSAKSMMLVALGWREWRPMFHFRLIDLHGYVKFGLYRTGALITNQFGLRLGHFLIGVILGAQALGYYNLAYNIALQPFARINPVLTKVAFPIFARVQDDLARLRRGYVIQLRFVALITAPLLFGLAAVAPVAVPTIFGAGWEPAVPLLQVLALVGFLRCINNPTGGLLLARGRADWGFHWSTGLLLTQVPGLVIGAYYGGATGVAVAWLALQVAYLIAAYALLVRPLIGLSVAAYFSSFAAATAAAGAMGVIIVLLMTRLPAFVGWPFFAALVSAGAAVYFGLLITCCRANVEELIDLIVKRRSREPRGALP